jgi:hypothetical protein
MNIHLLATTSYFGVKCGIAGWLDPYAIRHFCLAARCDRTSFPSAFTVLPLDQQTLSIQTVEKVEWGKGHRRLV